MKISIWKFIDIRTAGLKFRCFNLLWYKYWLKPALKNFQPEISWVWKRGVRGSGRYHLSSEMTQTAQETEQTGQSTGGRRMYGRGAEFCPEQSRCGWSRWGRYFEECSWRAWKSSHCWEMPTNSTPGTTVPDSFSILKLWGCCGSPLPLWLPERTCHCILYLEAICHRDPFWDLGWNFSFCYLLFQHCQGKMEVFGG